MKTIKLASIRIDGGTQSRAELNQETVSDYADALTGGAKFPPVVVFFDGVDHWLGDGFHRFFATKKIGALDIEADVREGAKRDAILFSLGANASHGLRRTNADKRKAVETLLADEEWAKWSDGQVAKAAGVSREFVNRLRSVTCDQVTSEPRTFKTKHGTTAVMKTDKIGIKKSKGKPSTGGATQAEPPPATESSASVDDPASDDGPTLAELVDELQAENTRLTAEITALVEADDQKAETIKWHRMYDHAMRSQSEAMAKAAAQQKEAKRLGNIVRECCRALNLEDPRSLLAEVKRLAARVEAA